ncbi:hypothetical protein GGR06_000415 [Bacteroides reticulotermitis]|uniref:Uncharacterized protein n=1 Tax=Bacteroides reticulotermitis TaxID=1133319 RepID=A0A840CTL5_9BACE|nr:hypothetical protein [Bacteroides reticulotermitis]
MVLSKRILVSNQNKYSFGTNDYMFWYTSGKHLNS